GHEPELAGRYSQGLDCMDAGHLDPRAALTALAARLGELGVAIRYGLEAPARSPAGRQVVDCTGLAARGQLTDLRGVKGEMLLLRLRELSLSRPVRLLHPRVPVYVVPRRDGRFMVCVTVSACDQGTRVSARCM